MVNRSAKIEFYVTPDKKQEIEHAAEEADMTVSSWCASRIDEILHNDALETTAQEYQAEQRIEELIARATDEIEAAAEELRETQVKTGVYSIATWELIKQDIGDVQRQDALSDAASRVRDTESLNIDIDVPSTDKESQNTSRKETSGETTTTETSAETDTGPEEDDEEWWNS